MYAQRAKLHSIPRKLDIPKSTLFTVIKKEIHIKAFESGPSISKMNSILW